MEILPTFVGHLKGPEKTPGILRGTALARANSPEEVYWLDEFLDGGFHKPDGLNRPLIILFSGPPGSGKSLLAQQICWRNAIVPSEAERLTSLIITTETSAAALAENMENLGLVSVSNSGSPCMPWYPDAQNHPLEQVRATSLPKAAPMTVTALPSRDLFVPGEKEPAEYHNKMKEILDSYYRDFRSDPSILVFDSVNVIPRNVADEFCQYIMEKRPAKPPASPDDVKFIILIRDTFNYTESFSTEISPWEYCADVCVRLDRTCVGNSKYLIRTLEIKKARYQSQGQALGVRLFKIYDKDPNYYEQGLFVFPSIHYIRSKVRRCDVSNSLVKVKDRLVELKGAPQPNYPDPEPKDERRCPTGDARYAASGPGPLASINEHEVLCWDALNGDLNWPVDKCFELIGGGIPLNAVTVLLGTRGLHRTNFAFQYILDGLANGENTMIVSFREHQEEVKETLKKVLAQVSDGRQLYKKLGSGWGNEQIADQLIARAQDAISNPDNTQLQIIHQDEGYITPEEFFHRLIIKVGEYSPTRVVVNSVFPWKSAYPLLADSDVLLPTMVDFFKSHQITSMFVVTGSESTIETLPGLLAQAEVVLTFELKNISWCGKSDNRLDLFCSRGLAVDGFEKNVPLKYFARNTEINWVKRPLILLTAARVPRARAGLTRAVLEYHDSNGGIGGLTMQLLHPEFPIE